MTDTEPLTEAERSGAAAAATRAFVRLFEPDVADDPHPTYARLRSACPVARGDLGGRPVALLSRYEDVHFAPRHPEHLTSAGNGLDLGGQPLLPLEVDPPLHTEYRRILNPRFTPRAVGRSGPRCGGSSGSSSTASPAAGRATSTRSCPCRCPPASSSP